MKKLILLILKNLKNQIKLNYLDKKNSNLKILKIIVYFSDLKCNLAVKLILYF